MQALILRLTGGSDLASVPNCSGKAVLAVDSLPVGTVLLTRIYALIAVEHGRFTLRTWRRRRRHAIGPRGVEQLVARGINHGLNYRTRWPL
jgi:hypothetical protein